MILPVKGHGAMHQDVQENAQRPAVHLRERGEGRSAKTQHVLQTAELPPTSPTGRKVSSEGFLLPSLATGGGGGVRQRGRELIGKYAASHSPHPTPWKGQPGA